MLNVTFNRANPKIYSGIFKRRFVKGYNPEKADSPRIINTFFKISCPKYV